MRKISVSALEKYWRCPELYRKIYVSKELAKAPPTPQMAEGVAVHAGIEIGLKQKIAGQEVDIPSMLSAAEAELEKEYKKIKLDIVDLIAGKELKTELSRRRVEHAVIVSARKLIPTMTPIAAEHHFLTEWRPGWNIEGFVDCIELSETGEVSVVDFKIGTSTRTPDRDSAEISFQLPLYAVMIRKTLGYAPTKGVLHHYVPSKVPHFTSREVEFSPEYMDAISMRVDRTLDAIERDAFPPGHNFWSCNSKRCDQFYNCPMGAGVKKDGIGS